MEVSNLSFGLCMMPGHEGHSNVVVHDLASLAGT